MGAGNQTDVRKLVREWRAAMQTRTQLTHRTLDELESHLWDEVESRMEAGASPRQAVLAASARLGHPDVLAGEFRKVIEWSRDRRPPWQTPYWTLVMWKNYVTVALRSMRKQAVFSILNIGGLALGLACAFLILLFVQHEWSFDSFHENADRIHRVEFETVAGEFAGSRSATFAAGVAPMLRERYPEFESLVLYDVRTPFLGLNGQNRRIGSVAFMDEDAFSVFSFPLVRGDKSTVLDDPYSIVLSRTAAGALFDDADPVGRTLAYNDQFDVTVTGVMEDVPTNSSLEFQAVAPMELMNRLMGEGAMENMTNWNYNLYALLAPGVTANDMSGRMRPFLLDLADGDEERAAQRQVNFIPIEDIHTRTDVYNVKAAVTNPKRLTLFLGIGALILVIAGVNFTNLATARAGQRAREVGVRKTSGADRTQLAVQFLGESVMMSLVAVVLAVILTVIALPYFRDLIGSPITFSLSNWSAVGMLMGIGVAVGLTAGMYPAFYLSSFDPAVVMKGDVTRGRRGGLMRKGLIVAQFGISVFLIVSTIGIHQQLRHMQSKALGFETEQVIFAPMVTPVRENFEAFKANLQQNARILNVTQAGNLPGRVNTSRGYNWPGQGAEEENGRSFPTVLAGYDYLETLGMELIAGRGFSEDVPADFENTYILNEAAAREIGYDQPADAVGTPFRAWDREMGEVIGVVRDFHFESLHAEIQPVVINIKPWISYAVARVAPGSTAEAIEILENEWQAVAAGYPMEYRFLDEDFERLYRTEKDLGRLFTVFSVLAVFIACLGLFGLAAYSAQRRTKEIGVRKVMGASTRGLVFLLSREFTVLVLVGFAVAAPLGWIYLDRWLDGFAYHTEPSPLVFGAAGLLALVIAWITVSYQAFAAATADPVKSLRYD